jgi:predicted 3-demethylubiquinone-9 3-methyltransferase (glyoxalase superfamily)
MVQSAGTRRKSVQKITTFLWFDNEAEEAAKFYTSIFSDSRIKEVSRYGEAGPGPKGSVMVVTLELQGQEFMLLNGGPDYKFTEAISLMINCESQEEIDRFWAKLTDGGEEGPCGWLKDRYGVSWQVTPRVLLEMQRDPDRERVNRVVKAMLQMGKIDIKALEDAYAEVGARR